MKDLCWCVSKCDQADMDFVGKAVEWILDRPDLEEESDETVSMLAYGVGTALKGTRRYLVADRCGVPEAVGRLCDAKGDGAEGRDLGNLVYAAAYAGVRNVGIERRALSWSSSIPPSSDSNVVHNVLWGLATLGLQIPAEAATYLAREGAGGMKGEEAASVLWSLCVAGRFDQEAFEEVRAGREERVASPQMIFTLVTFSQPSQLSSLFIA